jgi:hypothetical protein
MMMKVEAPRSGNQQRPGDRNDQRTSQAFCSSKNFGIGLAKWP